MASSEAMVQSGKPWLNQPTLLDRLNGARGKI
jgi:hypothetical protein